MKLLFKIAAGIFVSLIALGALISVLDPEGTKRRDEESKAREEQKSKDSKPDAVFVHGYQVGYSMAKSGKVKPNSEEVDALARQSANALKHEGGAAFKIQWKNGFWAGWSKGD